MTTIYHDEYAAWCGECRCRFCQPVPIIPDEPDEPDPDEALEWGGVDV